MSNKHPITPTEFDRLRRHPRLQLGPQQTILHALAAGELNTEQACEQLLQETLSRAPTVVAQRRVEANQRAEANRVAQEMRETAQATEPLYHPVILGPGVAHPESRLAPSADEPGEGPVADEEAADEPQGEPATSWASDDDPDFEHPAAETGADDTQEVDFI